MKALLLRTHTISVLIRVKCDEGLTMFLEVIEYKKYIWNGDHEPKVILRRLHADSNVLM